MYDEINYRILRENSIWMSLFSKKREKCKIDPKLSAEKRLDFRENKVIYQKKRDNMQSRLLIY